MSHAADRAAAIAWARAVVADPQTVYVDSETTGLGRDAEVIELAIIDADANTLFNRRFKPAAPIPVEASWVHHIFDRDVALCRRFADYWPEIRALLNGRRIVVYNVDFDRRLLQQTCARAGVPWDWEGVTWSCAMIAYAAWAGDWSAYHGAYKFKSLAFAAHATGDQPDHSALGDARACRAVVRRLSLEEGP